MRTPIFHVALLSILLLVGAGCDEPKTIVVEDEYTLPPPRDGRMANGDLVLKGENLTIPPDFPSDVPVYPGASVDGVTKVAAADAAALLLTTMDRVDNVATWYDAQTAGMWTPVTTSTETNKATRKYKKPGYSLDVTIELKASVTSITAVRAKMVE